MTRIGIFSDVHANIEALSTVLAAYKTEKIDKFVCLGDTVGYGGSPNECAEAVKNLVAFTILGNHDAAVAGGWILVYYEPAPGARLPRRTSCPGEQACARAPLLAPRLRALLLPRLAGEPRGVRVHLRARAGRALSAHLGRPRRGHLHRPLAPLQGVRPHAHRGLRGRRAPLRHPSGAQVRGQRRLGRPAARLRQPRELHDYDTDSKTSSSNASRTTSKPRPQDLRPTSNGTSATACSSRLTAPARTP